MSHFQKAEFYTIFTLHLIAYEIHFYPPVISMADHSLRRKAKAQLYQHKNRPRGMYHYALQCHPQTQG